MKDCLSPYVIVNKGASVSCLIKYVFHEMPEGLCLALCHWAFLPMTRERDITFCLTKFGDDTQVTGVIN